MSVLWLAIDDPAGPESERGYIERNVVALLSSYRRPELDPSSESWLGRHSNSERVRSSGLWNSRHVDEPYEPSFLGRLEQLAAKV